MLCVQNILSNFEENDPDREVVMTAWERMVDVARHINELKRQHERLVRTHELRTSLDGSVNIVGFGELNLEVIYISGRLDKLLGMVAF